MKPEDVPHWVSLALLTSAALFALVAVLTAIHGMGWYDRLFAKNLGLRGTPKIWPDFQKWDGELTLELYQAACLWCDREPSLPLTNKETKVLKQLRGAIIARQLSPHMGLDEAIQSAMTLHSDEEFAKEDAITVRTKIKRDSLLVYAKKIKQRPRFLFPGTRA